MESGGIRSCAEPWCERRGSADPRPLWSDKQPENDRARGKTRHMRWAPRRRAFGERRSRHHLIGRGIANLTKKRVDAGLDTRPDYQSRPHTLCQNQLATLPERYAIAIIFHKLLIAAYFVQSERRPPSVGTLTAGCCAIQRAEQREDRSRIRLQSIPKNPSSNSRFLCDVGDSLIDDAAAYIRGRGLNRHQPMGAGVRSRRSSRAARRGQSRCAAYSARIPGGFANRPCQAPAGSQNSIVDSARC